VSLDFDRREKASLYARAWIADYWILNLREQLLEVYREPAPAPQARYGHRYGATITLGPKDHVSPLVAPTATILVADLLP
jgi:Uma2 family endonuclease